MWQVFLNLQRNGDESVARQVVEYMLRTATHMYLTTR